MGFKPLKYKGREIKLKKAITEPNFMGRTVLALDPWKFVDLWLKRKRQDEARFYWQQSHDFYLATENLPTTSSPLVAYYCILNAVKALLIVKKLQFSEKHGVHGKSENQKGKISLLKEKVIFEGKGVLLALCNHLDENSNLITYNLKQLLYNLPYIHRAYCLTFRSEPEIFIPIKKPRFVRKIGSKEAWFIAEIEPNFINRYKRHINKILPNDFERDEGIKTTFLIRKKTRLKWEKDKSKEDENIIRLYNYHKSVRKLTFYIYAPTWLWYLKRKQNLTNIINRSSLTITFSAMHRLSELCRYEPLILLKHLESQHNWLISEFISNSLKQFIDETSAEITGKDFMIPGMRESNSK